MLLVLALVIIVPAVCGLLRWVAYLRFCRWLVRYSRDAAALTRAAEVAKAFRADSLEGSGEQPSDPST